MTESAGRKRQPARRMAFTDLGIRRLKPPKGGQELYWDAGHKGLALLVSAGGAKTFRSQYKLDGRWQVRTIGRFGEMTDEEGENVNVQKAREIAGKDRALANQGIDPREPKKPPPSSTRYADVVDQFIELYAKPRQRTWDQTERALKVNCKAFLNKPIAQISETDAYKVLDHLVASGRGPTARITLAWLRTLWRWAWRRKFVSGPIMDQVEIDYERKVRDRVYSDEEIKAIWQAAEELDPIKGAYIKLLVLLGPRKTALAHMRRSHLDDPVNPTLWTTPLELTKSKKTVTRRTYQTPLPALAQRILRGLKPTDGVPDLMFPGRHKGEPIDPGTPLSGKVAGFGGPADFNYHAVRHTIATWLEKEGHSEYERGLILNHSGKGGVTAVYSHGYSLDLKRQLLWKWADHVERLVTGEGVALLR